MPAASILRRKLSNRSTGGLAMTLLAVRLENRHDVACERRLARGGADLRGAGDRERGDCDDDRQQPHHASAYVGRRGSAPADSTPDAGSRRVTTAPMPQAPISLTSWPSVRRAARVGSGIPRSTFSWFGW